jgi:Fe2+ or Zn2+ uptake regulation protein
MPDVHTTAESRLRVDRQRYTGSRRRIIGTLAAADRPMSIPEVLDACRGRAPSSAYRNHAVLERAGIVRRVVTRDEFARYELAEDLTEHHHHLVCDTCGSVEDFTIPDGIEAELDRCLDRIAGRHGFTGSGHQLDLVGTCARCRG